LFHFEDKEKQAAASEPYEGMNFFHDYIGRRISAF
jgi:hypothetical protein